jgi:hypothetical protein
MRGRPRVNPTARETADPTPMPPSPFSVHTEATAELAAVDPATDVTAPLVVGVVTESCAACGVKLAADQRYCVDCGQPRGAPRLPATGPRAAPAAAPPPPRTSSRMAANTALIAGIGTLLLAMGIGVFIGSQGRSDSTGSAKAPAQTVTVISQGSGGTTAATGPPAAAAATPTPTSAAANRAAKKAAAKQATAPAPKKPTPPVVKVGSPGTGPGYQNGKFTGNFF